MRGVVARVRRGWVVNAVIVLALIAVGVMTFRVVDGGDPVAATTAQTVTVDTGSVQATVSASGNVEAQSTAAVSFEGDGGTVTAILVDVGDEVTAGQALARVDPTEAQQALDLANTSLDAAQASYDTVAAGRTQAETVQDEASVRSSQQQLDASELSLTQARQSLTVTRHQLDAAVTRAERALAAATSTEDRAAARTALTQARDARESGLLQARQQIAQAEQSVAAARTSLASTRAQVAVNAEGATDGELASARASVQQAQITVDQAQEALDETTLRAPIAGTVAAIDGSVGQSTSSSGSTTSTSDTTSTSTSTSTSGFVTLTSTDALEVTTYVAEADIADVEVGQSATVTLEASDTELTGEVTHVDTVQTVTNNVVEYGVTVRLARHRGVRLGATVQVVVTTGQADDVTRVSSSALTTVGDRTTATVLDDDGSTRTVEVTTGVHGDTDTEVLSGLEPGDRVVVAASDDSGTSGFTFPGAGGGGAPGGGAPGGGVGGP